MNDRWQKSADRENARRDARAPLLAHAGLVEHISATEQQAKVERVKSELQERLDAHHEERARAVEQMKLDLATLEGGPSALEAIEKSFTGRWAPSREYLADTLNREIARLSGRTPLEVFEAYRPRQRVDIGAIRVVVDLPAEEQEREAQAEEELTDASAWQKAGQ